MRQVNPQQLIETINCSTCSANLVCTRGGIEQITRCASSEGQYYYCVRCRGTGSAHCDNSLHYKGYIFCGCEERRKIISCFS